MKKRKRMMGIALAGMMMLSAVAIPQTLPQEVQESYSIVQTIEADAAEWKIGGFSGGTAWTKGWICINAKQNLWKTKYKSPRIYVYAYSQDGKTTKKKAGEVIVVDICDSRGIRIETVCIRSGEYIDLSGYAGYKIRIRRSSNTAAVRRYTEWWGIKLDSDGYFA